MHYIFTTIWRIAHWWSTVAYQLGSRGVHYCSRHGFLYIRGWMQMVIAPNDLFSWNNKYNKYNVTRDICTLSSWGYARELILCKLAFWSHEGVFFLDLLPSPHSVLSRLSTSPVWAQLTLIVPAWGTRSLSLQNGASLSRIRAHSLTGIQHNYKSMWSARVEDKCCLF